MSDRDANTSRYIPPLTYTQCPNIFFDEIMLEIDTLAEMKVTAAIIRQTFGWQKEEDQLSLSRLVELTGLSRQSVSEGVKAALKRGYVGRRKVGQSYIYGLRVTSQDTRLVTSQDIIPTKEREKESVVSSNELTSGKGSASEAKPQSDDEAIAIEKYLVDDLYKAMEEAGYALDNSDFPYHLGRAQNAVRKLKPTSDELEELPQACVDHFEIFAQTDVTAGLRYMRQQKAREKKLASNDSGGKTSYYERKEAEEVEDKQEAKRLYNLKYPTYGTRADGSWGVKE